MQIHCTKKLLDQLKVKPELNVEEEEPLFSWHANLITVNRRKTVFLVNDQNRYIIILNGLKANDFKKFDEIVIKGIRETFREEGIKEEVIEKYLTHSKVVTISKTKNRTLVARMNNSIGMVDCDDELLNSHISNSKLGVQFSKWMVGDGKNSYYYPNEELYQDLEKFAGESIYSSKAIQLKVTLKLRNSRI
jgi:hypothetical protein